MSGSRLVNGTLADSRDSDATVLNIYMAFLVVPVVGGGVGGLAGVALAWSYTKAANVTAEQLYGAMFCACTCTCCCELLDT